MKFNKEFIINLFYVGILLIICGLAIIFIPNKTPVDNFYSLYSDINIWELIFGKYEEKEKEEVVVFDKTKFYLRMKNAIDGVRNEVNNGNKFIVNEFKKDTLYFVPVGAKRCFDDYNYDNEGTLVYLYVGILANDYGYTYYAMGYDSSGYGINFISEEALLANNVDDVVVKLALPVSVDMLYSKHATNPTYSRNGDILTLDIINGFEEIAEEVKKDNIMVFCTCNDNSLEEDESSDDKK